MKPGDHLDFDVVAEPWSIIRLADGTLIKLRLVVADVVVTGGVDPGGHPNINVLSTNVIAVLWPGDANLPMPITSSTRLN